MPVIDSQGQDVGDRRRGDKRRGDQIPFKPESSPSQEIPKSLVNQDSCSPWDKTVTLCGREEGMVTVTDNVIYHCYNNINVMPMSQHC